MPIDRKCAYSSKMYLLNENMPIDWKRYLLNENVSIDWQGAYWMKNCLMIENESTEKWKGTTIWYFQMYMWHKFVMRDAEASRSKTHPLLENKKQNTFAFENNLEFTRVPWIHKSLLIYKENGSRIKTFTDLGTYLRAP